MSKRPAKTAGKPLSSINVTPSKATSKYPENNFKTILHTTLAAKKNAEAKEKEHQASPPALAESSSQEGFFHLVDSESEESGADPELTC